MATQLKQLLTSTNHDTPMVILPGVLNNRKWADLVRTEIVPYLYRYSQSDRGRTAGVKGADRLLTIAGYKMNPKTLPPVNKKLIGWEPSDEFKNYAILAAKLLFDGFIDRLGETPYSMRREASSGFPLFTRDPAVKADSLHRIFSNMTKVLDLIEKGDMDRLRTEYALTNIAVLGERSQSDSADVEWGPDGQVISAKVKERKAYLIDGSYVTADRRIPDFDSRVFAKRVRSIHAIPIQLNAMHNIIGNAMSSILLERYPHCFHVGSPWLECEKYSDHYAQRIPMSFDVKQFDSHVDPWFLNMFASYLESSGLRRGVKISAIASMSPAWIAGGIWKPHTGPHEDLPYSMGTYTDWTGNLFTIPYGLPSGSAYTSLIGKLFMSALTAATLVKMGLLPSDHIDWLYSHDPRSPVWLWNQSDDNVLWVDRNTAKRLDSFPRVMKSLHAYIDIEFEGTASYLSHNLVMSKGKWVAYPDPMRALTNILSPEVGWASKFGDPNKKYMNREVLEHWYGIGGPADPEFVASSKKFPAFGFFERDKLYTERNPIWSDFSQGVWDIISHAYPHTMDLIREISTIEEYYVNHLLSVDAINEADALFLMNPDYVHYRFSRDDITDGVYTLHYASFDVHQVAKDMLS